MEKINILVFDDETKLTERAVKKLKRVAPQTFDKIYVTCLKNEINVLENLSFDNIEGLNFIPDVILIDKEIQCQFTGILISSCLLNLNTKIPRISLTGAELDENDKRKFDESITKTELSNSPLSVAKKIENVVLYLDKKNWIYSQYEYILNEYNLATERGETDKIGIIDNILNKLESLIEKEMEVKIEATRKMMSKYDEEYKKIEDLDNKIVELLEKLNMRLDEEDE